MYFSTLKFLQFGLLLKIDDLGRGKLQLLQVTVSKPFLCKKGFLARYCR